MSIRSLSSRGPVLGVKRDSVASNASMVTRKIIKPIVPNNLVPESANQDEPSYSKIS
jgi:hypothetical protein